MKQTPEGQKMHDAIVAKLRSHGWPVDCDEHGIERVGVTRIWVWCYTHKLTREVSVSVKLPGETNPTHWALTVDDAVRLVEERASRYVHCHCCGASFYTTKPHDPERDTGYGTCEACHGRVAESWHKHGFPGERRITIEEARARLAKYA